MICVEHFRNIFQVKKNLSQDNYIRNKVLGDMFRKDMKYRV